GNAKGAIDESEPQSHDSASHHHAGTAAEMRGTLQALESDIAQGILSRPDYDLAAVYLRAETISAKHAVATLARTADLWHVAAALEAGCTAFASFDERQRQVAERCGLEVIPPSDPPQKTRKAKR
ncbi:MAG: PIN domain-containing protein, partial [Verrucomicrobiia bacterium]